MNKIETTKQLQMQINTIHLEHEQERLRRINSNERNDERVMNDTTSSDRALQGIVGAKGRGDR